MEQKKNILNFIGNIFITLVGIILGIILIALFVIFIKTNRETMEISDFMGYKPVICISNSMEPEFKTGDITVSKAASQNSINIGDIVSFRNKGEIIVHRVTNIVEENGIIKYETKGDSNNTHDEGLIEYNEIEGKVVFTIPAIGNVILMLKKPLGFLIVFFIPIALIAITYKIIINRKNIKELRKRKLLKRLQSKELLKDE